MTDDTPEPGDVRIDPSVRQIARLARETERPRRPMGVLPPFAGLLGRDRPAPARGPGPHLSYLTLGWLVVESVRERTTRETRDAVERVETVRESAGSNGDGRPEPTVGELLRRTTADATDDSPDEADGGHDREERDPERGPLDSVRRPEPDDGDDPTTVTDRGRDAGDGSPSTGRDWTPDDDAPATTGGGGDPAAGPTDPGGRRDAGAETEGASQPTAPRMRVVDWTVPGVDDVRTASRREPAPPGTPSHDAPPVAGGGVPRSNDDATARPELVVAERPVADREGAVDVVTGPTDPGRTGAGPGPVGTGSEGAGRRGDAAPAAGSRETTGEAIRPPREPPASSGDPSTGLPLSLEDVERPALDRFVERLSDELARHERIERERRGM